MYHTNNCATIPQQEQSIIAAAAATRQTTLAYLPVMIPLNSFIPQQQLQQQEQCTTTTTVIKNDVEVQTEKEDQYEYDLKELNRVIDEIVQENCICFLNFQNDHDAYCICQANRSEIVCTYLSQALIRFPNISYSIAYKFLFNKFL